MDLVRDQGSQILSHSAAGDSLQTRTRVIMYLQDPAMMVQHKTWAVFVLYNVVSNYKQEQDEVVVGQHLP